MKVLTNFKPKKEGKFEFTTFAVNGKEYVNADEPVCIFDTNKDYGDEPTYILSPNSIVYEIVSREEYNQIMEIIRKQQEENSEKLVKESE